MSMSSSPRCLRFAGTTEAKGTDEYYNITNIVTMLLKNKRDDKNYVERCHSILDVTEIFLKWPVFQPICPPTS